MSTSERTRQIDFNRRRRRNSLQRPPRFLGIARIMRWPRPLGGLLAVLLLILGAVIWPPLMWGAAAVWGLWAAAAVLDAALRGSKGLTAGVLAIGLGPLGASLVGYSLPSFFIGLVVIYFVIIRWQILPFPQYVQPWEDPIGFLQTMILPWLVLAVLYAAFYTRLTRSQMLETLNEDYIRTARAKGLPERVVVRKHALRAGLTPIVTAAGLDFAGLLGGAIILETIFSLPGLGSLAVSAVLDPDLAILVGVTLITAVFIIVANLVVDVLYAVIDPRVRLA